MNNLIRKVGAAKLFHFELRSVLRVIEPKKPKQMNNHNQIKYLQVGIYIIMLYILY